jgi:hypothetical protein
MEQAAINQEGQYLQGRDHGQSVLASRYYQRGIPETNVSFWVSMVTTFSASNIEAELEALVDNW